MVTPWIPAFAGMTSLGGCAERLVGAVHWPMALSRDLRLQWGEVVQTIAAAD